MVRPKKSLGQHFLKDDSIAVRIADSLRGEGYDKIVEIGPGTGVLTRHLLKRKEQLRMVELDSESVDYLQTEFLLDEDQLIEGDFLRLDLTKLFEEPFAVIGNFPYNISSQIVFRVLEHKDRIPEFAGMFQKEVAERLVAQPGSKNYGILSVLCELYYEREYLFSVEPEAFRPPPKVRSGVMRMRRRDLLEEQFDEKALTRLVKMAFNQRRKTLRNALKSVTFEDFSGLGDLLSKRAEQLPAADFVLLTQHMLPDGTQAK